MVNGARELPDASASVSVGAKVEDDGVANDVVVVVVVLTVDEVFVEKETGQKLHVVLDESQYKSI